MFSFVEGANISIDTDESKSVVKISVDDFNLYELNDVDTTKGMSNNDLLQWDESGTTSAWSFVSVTEALGDAANFAGVTGAIFFESEGLFGNTSDFTYSTAGRQLDVRGISTDGISCAGQLDVKGISSSYYVDIYAPDNGGLPLLELHGQGGLSASHGVKSWYAPIEAYAGISADGISCAGQLDTAGISSSGDITLTKTGDSTIKIVADDDNVTETDNPMLWMSQDGGGINFQIGIVGNNEQFFTGSKSNHGYMETLGAIGLQFATNNIARVTIDETGNMGLGTSHPEGATFSVVGGISASAGITGWGRIDSVLGISAGSTSDFNDQGVQGTKLKQYSEHVHAVGNVNASTAFDLNNGNIQTVTVAGIDTGSQIVFSFSNPKASGANSTITLIMTNGLAHGDVAWHSSVKWPGDVAPTLSASGVDIISFLTIDGGSTWYGFVGGINFS